MSPSPSLADSETKRSLYRRISSQIRVLARKVIKLTSLRLSSNSEFINEYSGIDLGELELGDIGGLPLSDDEKLSPRSFVP